MKSKYFKSSEFDCGSNPGTGEYIDPDLVEKLDLIREDCGFPLIINSGVRTADRNTSVGGAESSDHLIKSDGWAHGVDIQCSDSRQRYAILEAAFRHKVRRIGLYKNKNCVHLGNWKDNPQDVFWFT